MGYEMTLTDKDKDDLRSGKRLKTSMPWPDEESNITKRLIVHLQVVKIKRPKAKGGK